MPKTTGPCDDCGLCCQHLLVEANALDVLREPRIQKERPLGRVSLPVLEAVWIIAAPGRPCPFLTAAKACGIYPTRPNVCVAFVAGSDKCDDLRLLHGLPTVKIRPSRDKILTAIVEAAIAQSAQDLDSF